MSSKEAGSEVDMIFTPGGLFTSPARFRLTVLRASGMTGSENDLLILMWVPCETSPAHSECLEEYRNACVHQDGPRRRGASCH
jgi:hypothetical protein